MNNNNDNKQSSGRKIFVGGLFSELTDDEFKNYFEKFGRIIDAVVMRDRVMNRPRGFGFITFESAESVDAILNSNSTSFHELNGKVVEVKRAIPKKENSNNNLNVSNVKEERRPIPSCNVRPSYYLAYPVFPHYQHYVYPSCPDIGHTRPLPYTSSVINGTCNVVADTVRRIEIKPPPGDGKHKLSADALPFEIEDRNRKQKLSADALPFEIKDRDRA